MIQVENIFFQYEDGQPVLNGISLDVQQGEWLAVIGANGSGKSTLARHLNGLLLPNQGGVTVEGLSTADEDLLWRVREQVAFVFQNPDNQLVATSVEDDIVFGPENLGLEPAEIGARLERALAITGLTDKRHKMPHLLSGGEKQRVAIAGALAMQPRYLVLDEPTSMLDPQLRQSVIATLQQLHQELGMGIIYITNIMEEALLAQRIVVLDAGRIVKEGPPAEIFADHAWLRAHQLDMPPACHIASLLAQEGYAQVQGSLTLEDLLIRLQGLLSKTPPAATKVADEAAQQVPAQAADGAGVEGDLPSESQDGAVTAAEKDATASRKLGEGRSAAEILAERPKSVLIRVTDLGFTYQPGSVNAATALQGLNLEFQRGELTALIGHSGSGKSTLAQLLVGLMLPTAGTVEVKGQDCHDLPKGAIFRDVGLVFQYPEQQIFGETVLEEVAFGPRNFQVPEEQIEKIVAKALEDVGLKPELFLQRSPFSLSGGQKRRVCIASMLAMGAEILILDEPTAGLDEGGRSWIHDLARRLQKQGRTVVWISHNMEEVAELAGRILVLAQGKLLMQGSPAQVFAHERELAELGLDIPVAAKLVRRLRESGAPLAGQAMTVEAAYREISAWLGGARDDA